MAMDGYGKMAGGKGMSPRKAMAGADSGGSFGVPSYPGGKGVKSPMADMGRGGHMEDSARGIGTPVGGAKGAHGMQGAPDHGPMHDHFMRDGKA